MLTLFAGHGETIPRLKTRNRERRVTHYFYKAKVTIIEET